ncbi:hypothetical protein [Halobacteriaceae bacterium SHR40]|uniref:hypothetical protein n=1 Tax=Halovenus amylolytica TaxID=2500550 RepID=UPI000FE32843
MASPDSAGRVCVVATRDATFERCRAGFYPAPQSYDRTTTPFEYMAFYRTAPVSAITHYATVTDRIEQRRGDAGPMGEADWQDMIDPFSDEQIAVVFELGGLVALDSPVENDQNGVRGPWYCSLEALQGSTTLSELATRSDQ